MLNNRYAELVAQRNQLIDEIVAFNKQADIYRIEPIPLSSKELSKPEQEDFYEKSFSSLTDLRRYLQKLGFKKIGTRTYSNGRTVASIDFDEVAWYNFDTEKWKVSFQ